MADRGLVPVERIEHAIIVLRGHKVMLDDALAELYGVPVKVLDGTRLVRETVVYGWSLLFVRGASSGSVAKETAAAAPQVVPLEPS